ncbi:methionine synthase [Brachybacterium phenoliresistens]|uniref:Methionine synthase n=1 Tax=Brachybacterium phenoliresistens TaxID=396014 RepID=Z9JXN0_9MICO|nr:methionine synthase [Brachybacterium phenoliresistens]EWS82551.1 methionine synthase [Brachybacterium phenoliresistens]
MISAPAGRAAALLEAVRSRVVVADGAMGTMIQAEEPTLEDYQQHEGCNEILNVTRPDIIRGVHDAYLAAGVDAIESNTFGANWSNLSDYGIEDRIRELARAGAALARERADAFATAEQPRWVLGSMGPGTKLPSLQHTTYAHLRDTFAEQAAGLIEGGADALLIETSQDLLQTKAAVTGCRRAVEETGVALPIITSITVETTGTMLMGSEIGAALTALQSLDVDVIGLNCATGPDLMSEHLRILARHSEAPLVCMPNAGLPELGPHGAVYPLTPEELAAAHAQFVKEFGLGLVGGCCGTTPEHMRQVVEAVRGHALPERSVQRQNGVSSLYTHTDLSQDASYLAIGERTNSNGSKAFREALLEGRFDDIVDIARAQTRDGAHLLDVCVDYVGRDGVEDIRAVVSRLASASTLPLVIDSTEPDVIRAGLELVGGRAVVNSVNFEDGDAPGSRFRRIMPAVKEHGAAVIALTIDEQGQARTAEHKVAIASRLIDTLVADWDMRVDDIIVDALTFPIATGQEETRRDAIETIAAIREITAKYPGVHTTLGVSNVSFGLSPAARTVLNSVFLHEATQAGLDSAIVHAAKILPRAAIPDEQWQAAEDLVWDRRRYDDAGNLVHDPLAHLLETFSGVDSAALRDQRAAELAALPTGERLERRIIDGARKGLEEDIDLALGEGMAALDIVNTHLLGGMKVVGELFGSGQMQLPFVLQSAEVMKAAVALLEPHMEKVEGGASASKGTIVLATVRGDVHDIGKNLVDIILTNNGYTVVNIGIKQPISAMIDAAIEHDADVIGMSGLLVKSTVVMKENLEELVSRRLADRWPILLGGAALTRPYVEDDLASQFPGVVRYARDAFEGLRLMEPLVAVARGADPDAVGLPPLRTRRHHVATLERTAVEDLPARSDVAADNPVPDPPFWGTRIVKGIQLSDYASLLDERATFMGQWGLKAGRGEDGASYEELVATEGRPRLAAWMERIAREHIMDPTVIYGYFPVWSEGNDLVVAHHGGQLAGIGSTDGGSDGEPGTERLRFTFPRQTRDRHLCIADYFRPRSWVEETGRFDVLPVQLVTVGDTVSTVTAQLFAENRYREYMELHGLSVQLTESLAEFWHSRVREELGFADEDPAEVQGMLDLEYRGARLSLGYPACPDMEDRRKVVALLRPERVGITLSDELQLHPEQSTDAFVVHHPEATYFSM